MRAQSETKESLIEHFCFVHENVNILTHDYLEKYRRRTFVTPKSYLSFIDSYKTTYNKKLAEIQTLADRMNNGLEKLKQAGEQVERMKVDLKVQEKELIVAQEQASVMLRDITASRAVAEKKKNEVEAVKEELAFKAAEIEASKAEADRELEAALPALERAEKVGFLEFFLPSLTFEYPLAFFPPS